MAGTVKTTSLSSAASITRSTYTSIDSNNTVEPTIASRSPLSWTYIATESLKTVPVSHTDTVIGLTSISHFSNTGVQPLTIASIYVSTAGISLTVDGVAASVDCGLPKAKTTTPLITSSASFTLSSISTSYKTYVTDTPSSTFGSVSTSHKTHVAGTPSFTSSNISTSLKTNISLAPSQSLTASIASSSITGNETLPNWTQWSDWSSCSKLCVSGQYVQQRERHCNVTVKEECIGEETETRLCDVTSGEDTVFNVTAILIEWAWDDSLLVKCSSNFISLENTLQQMIIDLNSSDSVIVTLISCRRGSVIVHFSVAFRAVDSDQVVRLVDNMRSQGLLSSLVLVNITADKVPNQAPVIIQVYVASAFSLRVSWTAVMENIEGYHVAFRSISSMEWKSAYTIAQTHSLHVTNLTKGDVYRVRVAAFNAAGNGIPSNAVEILIKEEVPRVAPVVSVSDMKDTSSLTISWSGIPEEHVQGKLLGYHVIYTPLKIAGRHIDAAEPRKATAPASGRNKLTLTSLSSFTLYRITVAGYTAKGDGQTSEPVFGETCACPKTLYTNWAPYPPYVTQIGQQPGGIIGQLIHDMISYSCGTCSRGYGDTILSIAHNGKGASAKKTSMGGVLSDIDHKTHVSFPVIGNMDDERYLKEFVFIPVVASPGIAFISLANKPNRHDVISSALNSSWPIVVLSVMTGFIVAVLIWISERGVNAENFSQSFLRGTGNLTWFSLVTMTTVGFGEKVPAKAVSKLLTIIWILVSLVLISTFVAILTVSLTVMTTNNERSVLYGAKVTALSDSPSHRLGIRRNAAVDPKETLDEAFQALENRETEGLLLDAYVAGSGVNKNGYRVNKVIDVTKGLGVVLAGDAMVLRHRVHDFVKKNARKITEIIQNSTTPLKQPEQSVAEEKVQTLVDAHSPIFRDAIAVAGGALAVSVFLGVAWEFFRKRRQNRAQGKNEPLSKSDMEEVVNDFYKSFTQAYNRSRNKYIKQWKIHRNLSKEQQTTEN